MKKHHVMKTIFPAMLVLCAVAGCVHNGSMTQEEQYRIMREVEASRQAAAAAFPQYIDICVREFPSATNARDDGGARMSAQGSVNVALDDNGDVIVCSVNIASSAIERIWANGRTYSLSEFKMSESARNSRQVLAEADAAQIISGNREAFLRAAKRSITHSFKDPDSALFRDLYISNKGTPTLCGEVNAKNSYGGYVGYKRFFYNRAVSGREDSDSATGAQFLRLEAVFCKDKFLDLDQ